MKVNQGTAVIVYEAIATGIGGAVGIWLLSWLGNTPLLIIAERCAFFVLGVLTLAWNVERGLTRQAAKLRKIREEYK